MEFKLAAVLMGSLASFNGARFRLDLVSVSEQVRRLTQFAGLRISLYGLTFTEPAGA